MKGQSLYIYDYAVCQETVTTDFVNFDDSITNSKQQYKSSIFKST